MDAFSMLALMKAGSSKGQAYTLPSDLATLMGMTAENGIGDIIVGGLSEYTLSLSNQTAISGNSAFIQAFCKDMADGKNAVYSMPFGSANITISPITTIYTENFCQIQSYIPFFGTNDYWFTVTACISLDVGDSSNSYKLYIKLLKTPS